MSVKQLSLHQAHPVLLSLMTIFGLVAIHRCPKTRRWKRSEWRCCLVIMCIIINISTTTFSAGKYMNGDYVNTCLLIGTMLRMAYLVFMAQDLLRHHQLGVDYFNCLGDAYNKYPRLSESSITIPIHLFLIMSSTMINSLYLVKFDCNINEIYVFNSSFFVPILIDYFMLCIISPLIKLSKSTLSKVKKYMISSRIEELPPNSYREPGVFYILRQESDLQTLLRYVDRLQCLTEQISLVN